MLELNSLDGFPTGLLSRIARNGRKDKDLERLKTYIVNGWPRYLHQRLQPYSKSKEEYTMQNGIIYHGLRVVPPKTMRAEILALMHSDHPGITRMSRLARQYFWWPSLDADVNAHVQKCVTCQVNARKQIKENLTSWPEAQDFAERAHVDIATYQGHHFLVFIDAYSRWIDVQYLRNLSSEETIAAMRRIFKYIGLVRAIVSDNGTRGGLIAIFFRSADSA